MNKIVKNTLILTAITVVAGLLLGVVYGVTKDPIAKAQEEAKQEAFRSVLSDAETFESDTEFDADAASGPLSVRYDAVFLRYAFPFRQRACRLCRKRPL